MKTEAEYRAETIRNRELDRFIAENVYGYIRVKAGPNYYDHPERRGEVWTTLTTDRAALEEMGLIPTDEAPPEGSFFQDYHRSLETAMHTLNTIYLADPLACRWHISQNRAGESCYVRLSETAGAHRYVKKDSTLAITILETIKAAMEGGAL